MPVPKPGPGESERDFIGRCISTLHKTDPERPDDQIIAMCYNTWRQSREQIKKKEVFIGFHTR